MTDLSRRGVLAALTLPALAACSAAGEPRAPRSSIITSSTVKATPSPHPSHASVPLASYHSEPAPLGTISTIPTAGRQVAITIDDGIRPDVVHLYTEASARHDVRVTFFANGCYDSWRANKEGLIAGIESGRILMGNHTFSHPNLTTRTDAQIAREITRNERHFKNLLGVDLKPYVRPPYGYTNARVNRMLHELGYSQIVMWNGTLGDDQNISASRIEANARTYLAPGNIVIGHANHPGILNAWPNVHSLLTSRHLTSVTIKDVVRPR